MIRRIRSRKFNEKATTLRKTRKNESGLLYGDETNLNSDAVKVKKEFVKVVKNLYDAINALDNTIDVLDDMGFQHETYSLDEYLEELNDIGFGLQKEAEEFIESC